MSWTDQSKLVAPIFFRADGITLTFMKIAIRSVKGHGNSLEEAVRLAVLQDCNLHDYLLADTTYSDGGRISNKDRHTYWFPNREVKKNDYVVLHTGSGTYTSKPNTRNGTTHHLYWGLQVAVWNDTGDEAILFEIHSWKAFKVE